eukprot:scaffold770_cov362-Pavlova_lutheri.AAC.24
MRIKQVFTWDAFKIWRRGNVQTNLRAHGVNVPKPMELEFSFMKAGRTYNMHMNGWRHFIHIVVLLQKYGSIAIRLGVNYHLCQRHSYTMALRLLHRRGGRDKDFSF